MIEYSREAPGTQPDNDYPPYGSTVKRAPKRGLVSIAHTLSEITGPTFDDGWTGTQALDLTTPHAAAPLGERIIVSGRVLDEDGRAVRHTLVEIWQANAAGRYFHPSDQHNAPLDPNFTGAGHAITDEAGHYRFLTIRPGSYPWRNTNNAWRPAHIHFSVFGPSVATRLVTQMYFPGDPLLAYDPVYHSIPDPSARERLVCVYEPHLSEAEFALGFRFDIVLRGRHSTPLGH